MHTGAALWRTVWRFLRKLKIEMPYDPAVPLIHIYLEKTIIPKDIGTPKFTAALFSRTWKDMEAIQMSIDRGMDKENVTHTQNGIIPFATTWMDLEFVILNEVSQRKTNTI